MNSLQFPENDVEKRGELKLSETDSDTFPYTTNTSSTSPANNENETPPTPVLLKGKLATWNAKVEGLAGLEARGITRVLSAEKHDGSHHGYLQMFAMWSSINLVAINIVTGLLGPIVFELGWVDSVCIVIFANAASCCGVAYPSTFSPESGNRTMVRVRVECVPRTR